MHGTFNGLSFGENYRGQKQRGPTVGVIHTTFRLPNAPSAHPFLKGN